MNQTVFRKENFIKAVFDANKELYNYIKFSLKKEDFLYSNTIGCGGDNSLNIDLKAEKIFLKHLKKFGNIYSEEFGFLDMKSKYTIVIDPLDGSNNFLSNLPYYGTSVALKKEDELLGGFVTNLVTGLLTYRIFDEEVKYFSLLDLTYQTMLYISKSNLSVFERAYDFPQICKEFKEHKIKFRNLGATALSLCDAKKYDFVLVGGNLRAFDIEAAIYICKDLHIFKTDNYLLISKDYNKIILIKDILKV